MKIKKEQRKLIIWCWEKWINLWYLMVKILKDNWIKVVLGLLEGFRLFLLGISLISCLCLKKSGSRNRKKRNYWRLGLENGILLLETVNNNNFRLKMRVKTSKIYHKLILSIKASKPSQHPQTNALKHNKKIH